MAVETFAERCAREDAEAAELASRWNNQAQISVETQNAAVQKQVPQGLVERNTRDTGRATGFRVQPMVEQVRRGIQ